MTHQVVKREIIQLAELCLSRWWIISGTWWYWVSIWRYWLVLGQYMLVLLGIRWYRVSKGLVCLYILEKVEIWSGDTDASQTDRQTTEYSATQLVYSIKFKLSHAIFECPRCQLRDKIELTKIAQSPEFKRSPQFSRLSSAAFQISILTANSYF